MSAGRCSRVAVTLVAVLSLSFAAISEAGAEPAPRSLGEIEVALLGLTAGVDPAEPVVPKETASGVRILVTAGGQALSSTEVARLLGGPFEVEAELSGPGLPSTLSLPVAGSDAIPSPDPLVLTVPGLPTAGEYDLANVRLVRGGRPVLDVEPRRTRRLPWPGRR